MKKLLSLLLVLVTVVCLFTACPAQTNPGSKTEENQGQTGGQKDTSDTDEWGRPLVESSLSDDLDFGEETVNIYVEAGRLSEFYAEQYTDDLINDSILDRNTKVENDLNVKLNFMQSSVTGSAFVSEIETIVNAGTNDYDITVGYAYFMSEGVRGMNYANLYDIPNLDLAKPWWNQKFVEEATLADQLYFITGDLSLSSTYNTGCMFFNKRLADEEFAAEGGSDYLYQLVVDGKWTIDAFTDLVKSKYRDDDGDGVPSEGDFYGYGDAMTGPLPADAFMFGMGAFITKDNAEGIPELVFNSEHTVNVLHKLFVLFDDSEGVLYNPGADNYYNNGAAVALIRNKFINGEMIFYTSSLNTATAFLDMKDDYGLLPMPKYDEAQAEYYTSTNDGYQVIMIPSGIEESDRAEMVGATLEKLAEESYRTVNPNYFEVVMKYRYIRSEDETDYDLEMYELILNGNTYNFGLLFSSTMDDPSFAFRHLIGRDHSENFASYWDKKDTRVTNRFNNLVEWFTEE